ncbi:hypothetical protein CHS0354_014862 [Potamilus streckersoni]|uniref:type I protein arginine methyltransferase n=1 Tax=Potamilus streckersoni TaxID=2493646 RepID=A0AAE0RMB7_9BIVA|nr:hypothetical protein CHS0354_014862 [Potamilus streckersoni]
MTESDTSTDYFSSYGDLSVHELMLKDRPRTEAYKTFIEKNAFLFRNKIVLDVGAGTGILSLFAVRAGAKRVFAVEASSVADGCEKIIKLNKFDDRITVIKGLIEEVELPEPKVDIIISEWMGFYLLHESMLDSVIFAREKWLEKDGIILPSRATIYISPVNMQEYYKEHFEFWKDVYGFDFTPLLLSSLQSALQKPAITAIKPNQCVATHKVLANFDLSKVSLEEVQYLTNKLSFDVDKAGSMHGFAVWFDVEFDANNNTHLDSNRPYKCIDNSCSQLSPISCDNHTEQLCESVHKIILSTSPECAETHWKQTVCFLPASLLVEKGDKLCCKMELSQDEGNKRHYNISIEMLESIDDESDEEDDDYEDEEDLGEDPDTTQHPIPCTCGAARCRLISAIMEKYDEEQNQLEMEAEFVDVSAEVNAAQILDNDSVNLESSEDVQDIAKTN